MISYVFYRKNSPWRDLRPGWFLADNEDVERKTRQIAQEGAVATETGGKYVPMGMIWPVNDAKTALESKGIVFIDTAPTVERPY